MACISSCCKAFVFSYFFVWYLNVPGNQRQIAQNELYGFIIFFTVAIYGEFAVVYFVRRGSRSFDSENHDPLKASILAVVAPFLIVVMKKKTLMMMDDLFYVTIINVFNSAYEIFVRTSAVQRDRFVRQAFMCCRYKDDILALGGVPPVVRRGYCIQEIVGSSMELALPPALALSFYAQNYAGTKTAPKGLFDWLVSLGQQYLSEVFADGMVSKFGPNKPYLQAKDDLQNLIPIVLIGAYPATIGALIKHVVWGGVATGTNSAGECVAVTRTKGTGW